jgi:glycosyltransferase involved in cell wall biosynthesis
MKNPNFQYKFTIFTPCYNSEKFIHRVYESVNSQTFRDFEWLIIDDFSTDSTSKILQEYLKNSNFPIRIITNESNKMLYHNFNLAFDQAKGELMVFAGHDDRFQPETLEIFNKIWCEYGASNISGIKCFCKDQNGNIIGNLFPKDILIERFFTLFEKYIYGPKEKFGCTRTEILRENKFDIEGNQDSESFLWFDIGLKYKTIFINDVLRTYYIEPENENALTKSSRKRFSKNTYNFYLKFLNYYIKEIPKARILKIRFHFALVFYSYINNYRLFMTLSEVKRTQSKILLFLFALPAFVLSRYLDRDK